VNVKKRFWLCKRGNVFYLKHAATKKITSLGTTDEEQAQRLLFAKIESLLQPSFSLNIAKTYLAAADPKITTRTWKTVMTEFTARGRRDSTKNRRGRGAKSKAFDSIRDKKLIETTADDLRTVLADNKTSTNHFLRCWHNLATGLGWLPWPIIPPKLWPKAQGNPKRAVTQEEHARIIAAEKNTERKLYYELLWETGAAQTDAANLTAENIDRATNVLS
jgi:hypothetical protein